MKIAIEIPEEFETDVYQRGMFGQANKLVEFFDRIESAISCKQVPTCALYEKEIAEMFSKAFSSLEIIKSEEGKSE